MRFKSPSGSPIIGTKENVPGCALATHYTEQGDPQYDGETTMYWDDQTSVTAAGGGLVYIDDEGVEWRFDQLIEDVDAD